MTSGDDPGTPSLESPPVVRPHALPSSAPRLPMVRRPHELRLATIATAAGMALAVEAFRFAVRAGRKRSVRRSTHADKVDVTVAYSWTRITYERRERS